MWFWFCATPRRIAYYPQFGNHCPRLWCQGLSPVFRQSKISFVGWKCLTSSWKNCWPSTSKHDWVDPDSDSIWIRFQWQHVWSYVKSIAREKFTDWFKSSHLWKIVTWTQICVSLNHRKVMRAELTRLIPRMLAVNPEFLVVLTERMQKIGES